MLVQNRLASIGRGGGTGKRISASWKSFVWWTGSSWGYTYRLLQG